MQTLINFLRQFSYAIMIVVISISITQAQDNNVPVETEALLDASKNPTGQTSFYIQIDGKKIFLGESGILNDAFNTLVHFKSGLGDNDCFTPYKDMLISDNRKYLLVVSNARIMLYTLPELLVYNKRKLPDAKIILWQNFDKYIDCLKVQNDGNLVAYAPGNNAVWSSETSGRGGAGTKLKLQDDGNLVLYSGGGAGEALWATGTCGGVMNGCGAMGKR